MNSDLSSRFCPRCGTPLYASLTRTDASPDSFIPLLNSLYNLLATRRDEPAHPDRRKYLPEFSENVMIRRCRLEHEETARQMFQSFHFQLAAADRLKDLYSLALSNALAGYTYRSVEEMICKRTNARLSEEKKQWLVDSMYEQCGEELAASEYRVLDRNDPVDGRLTFCLALRWDNRHIGFMLADEAIQAHWWDSVVAGSMELNESRAEQVYRAAFRSRERGLSERDRAIVQENLVQDLLHGYVVKLAESLDPI
jgi:hypothetical protein